MTDVPALARPEFGDGTALARASDAQNPMDLGPAETQHHAAASCAVVDCGGYVDGHRLPGTHDLFAAREEVRDLGRGFVWIGLHEPDADQMREVGEVFGLHRLAVDDAVRAHQRPKVERYDDTVFVVLKTVKYVPHESMSQARDIVRTGEIMIFVGPDFVVTVRRGDFSELTGVRREMDADPHRLRLGPFAIMHAIADHVVDDYRDVALRVEADVDMVEEQIFAPRSTTEIDQIYPSSGELGGQDGPGGRDGLRGWAGRPG